MNDNIDILSELEQMGSTLGNMSRKMPYEIPTDYFINLTASIIEHVQVQQQDDPMLDIAKAPTGELPAGYFNKLPGVVLAAAKLSELPQQMPYSLPETYFNELPQQILNKAKTGHKQKVKPARIVILSVRIRWAAAALLVLCLGLGSYEFLHTKPAKPEMALAKVPQANLKEYVKQNIDDFDADMIVSNLQAVDVHNIQTSAHQLDEQDIIQYLDETGWDVDASDSKTNNKVD